MKILSWLAALQTLVSLYLIGELNAYGHLVGLGGSLCWIFIFWRNNWALVSLNAVFVILYVKNFIAWSAL